MKEFFLRFTESVTSNLKRYNFRAINFRLLIYVITLSIIGIRVIESASDGELQDSQLQGMIIGIVIVAILTFVNYNFILGYSWLYYIFSMILLCLVAFSPLRYEAGGAYRWLEIGSFRFQPSELTKIILIMFFAMFLSKHRDKLKSWRFFFICVAFFGAQFILILKQPDLSTSIVIFSVFCVIMFIAGLSYRIIGIILAIVIPTFAILAGVIIYLGPDSGIIEEYQYNRIMAYVYQNSDNSDDYEDILYQQENSVMAIGSGGLTGKGLDNNTVTSVKNGNYISEPETDFIFTIVGEELGFVGSVAVIILLSLITFECMRTGVRASNLAGKILCIGFGSWIAVQSFLNICVVTMLIPNTGLPLPFVSYGQTSLVCLYIGVGLVMNVSIQQQKINLFQEVR